MNNIITDSYILYSDTIELTTGEAKENNVIVETPPHQTYDIVQSLYASFQFKIIGEADNRCLKVNIADLNKLSCDVTKGRLTYTRFESITGPTQSDIIEAIQSAIEDEIENIALKKQYTKASKLATADYSLMFKVPLIYSGLGFDSIYKNTDNDVDVSEIDNTEDQNIAK